MFENYFISNHKFNFSKSIIRIYIHENKFISLLSPKRLHRSDQINYPTKHFPTN